VRRSTASARHPCRTRDDRITPRAAFLAAMVLTATLASAVPPAIAQQPGKVFRLGILSPAARPDTKIFDAFRKGLADLGYIDGQNIRIEYRLSAGDVGRLLAMAEELVRLPVDIIVADGTKSTQIAHKSTRTIPIVGGVGPDPVAAGLIKSFAHPDGNVTGYSSFGVELSTKRLQLLREASPEISHMAALRNLADPISIRNATEDAARTLGVELSTIEVATPEQISAGFQMAIASGAKALVVLPDAMFWNERTQIVALAAKHRMPAIYPEREYADDGGLMAYGADVPDNFRLAAGYVDRILKGAKPGDLPIQQPVKFDFIVNMKTAKALGLTIPPSILARADEVIE
jgi:putative ABC transport system substrate-binding protein